MRKLTNCLRLSAAAIRSELSKIAGSRGQRNRIPISFIVIFLPYRRSNGHRKVHHPVVGVTTSVYRILTRFLAKEEASIFPETTLSIWDLFRNTNAYSESFNSVGSIEARGVASYARSSPTAFTKYSAVSVVTNPA